MTPIKHKVFHETIVGVGKEFWLNPTDFPAREQVSSVRFSDTGPTVNMMWEEISETD